MQRTVEVVISIQAKNMLEQMPNINEEDFLNWFCNVRKISAGGGDLVSYLEFLKDVEASKNG